MDSLVLEAKHIMDLYSDIADSKPASKSDSKSKFGFHFECAHWLALRRLLRAPLSQRQFGNRQSRSLLVKRMTRKRFKCHYSQIKKTLGGKNVVESLVAQMWLKQMIIHPMFPFDMMDIMFVVGLYLGLLSEA